MRRLAWPGLLQLCARLTGIGDEDEDLVLRNTIGLLSVFIGVICSISGGTIYLLFDVTFLGVLWLSTSVILTGISWLFFTRRISQKTWVYCCCVPVPFYALISAVMLGGLSRSGGIMIWTLVAPMISLSLIGPQQSRGLIWLSFASLAASFVIPGLIQIPNRLPVWVDNLTFFYNFGAASLFIIVIFWFFVEQRNRFREQSERLLLNILPQEIAVRLKRESKTIADSFSGASVLFADIVNFTPLSASMSPEDLVGLLNDVFSAFDVLVEKYGVEKIKTIGDCYMVAAGIPRPRNDHAEVLTSLALEMRNYAEKHTFRGRTIAFRMGINSGCVVAGVIGQKKFVYDLWGDAVNTASRMESHGTGGCIQITEATYELIKDKFFCEPKGNIQIKGKGEMAVWHVNAAMRIAVVSF
jgi:guanylate cyclase